VYLKTANLVCWCQFTRAWLIPWVWIIKLLEHAMKLVVRVLENRIRQESHAKYRAKGKKVYFGFMDLEKAFSRVPRKVMRWAMHKLGVDEWLLSAVMIMYADARTVVRTVCSNSEVSSVGVHQGSGLSCLLFAVVMEVIFREFQVCLRWELLYADGLVMIVGR